MVNTEINVDFTHGPIKFNVSSNTKLEESVIAEIQNLPLSVLWSDGRSKNYSLDTKLSNGYWLENIFYNNDLTEARALILNQKST